MGRVLTEPSIWPAAMLLKVCDCECLGGEGSTRGICFVG